MFKVDSASIRKQLKWSRWHTHTHTKHISSSIANLTASWYFIKIKYSEPNISAAASVSPLERDWSTKPIIYINICLAFRYVTSQIWKYYGIFGFMPNERGRIHEHKAPFRKQLSAQTFKVYSFVSLCERRVQNQHMVTVWGRPLALQYCGRPLLDWGGWIACICRKASCTEPRCPYRDGSVRIHVPCHPYDVWWWVFVSRSAFTVTPEVLNWD